jgi:predicted GNAT family acetyltransferase
MLVYTKLKYPSVILEGNPKTAEVLLEKLQIEQMIMPDIPRNYAQVVKETFPSARFYMEDRMLIKRNQLCSISSRPVKRLDMSDVHQLVLLREEVTEQSLATYTNLIQTFAVYGVFVHEELVSSSQAFVQLPEVWVIGRVYTRPEYRNRGFATQVTYALTKEALEKANFAVLFVRSDNYPAIRVYTKIGYRKIDERIWFDMGTGVKP